ncbi:Lysophospholipase D gdpd1 [Borealophlyctis nickersoniae]|nr:Lysophospholipase D gdpd1 [Borealophlyctis nickersoniae]
MVTSRKCLLPFAPTVFSHRGGSLERVENTLPAFRYSANMGEDIVLEMDCHLTKDGKAVVFHDQDLVRLCGVQGTIEDYNYDDLPPLLIRPELSDNPDITSDPDSTRIPLLTTVLDAFPNHTMQIDVKHGPLPLVRQVGRAILDRNRSHLTVWGSFRSDVGDMIEKEFGDQIPRFLTIPKAGRAFALWSVGLLGWMEIREAAFVMPNVKWFMWPGFLRGLNRKGVAVILFGIPGGGINTVEGFEEARRAGANGICSDRPTLLREWLQVNKLRRVEDAFDD